MKLRQFSALLLLWGAASAQAQVSLTPSVLETSTAAGVPKRVTYTITNTGKGNLTCNMSVRDLGMTPVGFLTGANEAKRGCSEAITLTPRQFLLPAGQSKQVTAVLRLPPGSGGGYYASVECEALPDRNRPTANGPRIEVVKRMSGALLVACTSQRPQIKLKVERLGLVRKGSGWVTEARVVNEGNIHFKVAGRATVLSRNGSVLSRQTLGAGNGYVLPGSPRNFNSTKPVSLPDGAYSIKVEMAGPGGVRAANTESFLIKGASTTAGKITKEVESYLDASAPSIAIDRPRIHYALPLRSRRNDGISVQNVTRSTVTVQPVLLNWGLDQSADLMFSPKALANGRGAVSFIEATPNILTLKPGQRGRISIAIKAPATGAGEYYGAIFFAKPGEALPKDPKLIRSRSTVFTLAIKGTESRSAKLAFLKHQPGRDEDELVVTATNTGNALVELGGHYSLQSGSKNMGRGEFGEGVVLVPGSTAAFRVKLPKLPAGSYLLDLSTTVGSGGKNASLQTRFSVKR